MKAKAKQSKAANATCPPSLTRRTPAFGNAATTGKLHANEFGSHNSHNDVEGKPTACNRAGASGPSIVSGARNTRTPLPLPPS